MKLDATMLKELIKEAAGPSMLLEEPVIAESSFNRIKDKIDKTNVRFVVISADRHNFSRNENDQRYSELQAAFKANGFPFTKLQGAWTEKDDEGNEVRVVERSLIATEEDRGDVERGEDSLFDLAKSLTEKYEQDAFIYGWIDETGERQIQARNQAGKYAGYGSWQSIVPVAEDSEFWSRVRGSTFVFKEQQVEESLDMPAGRDTTAMAKDLEGSTIGAVYTQMMKQTNDKKGFQKTKLHKDLRNLTGTAEAYDTQKIEQFIKDLFDGQYEENFALSLSRILKDGYLKKHFVQSDEMFEVDAPNSVIEAMIKAEMHKGKKIKFVRRKK